MNWKEKRFKSTKYINKQQSVEKMIYKMKSLLNTAVETALVDLHRRSFDTCFPNGGDGRWDLGGFCG